MVDHFTQLRQLLEDHSEQDGDEDEEDEDGVCTGHPILAAVVPDQGRVHIGVERLVVELSDVGTGEKLKVLCSPYS